MSGHKPWMLPRGTEGLTSSVAPARRYDALLNHKDNFEVDRSAADELRKIFPAAAAAAAENRRLVERAVTLLASELEVDQFLDIGCGLPTNPNVHQVAQLVEPRSRVLYVDHDELVAVHARALMAQSGQVAGWSDFITGDLRRPKALLDDPRLRNMFNRHRPVAVLINAVLHFIPDNEHPYEAVKTLMDAMPSGSYLLLTHGTGDFMTPEQITAFDALPREVHGPLVSRTREEIADFFGGLELVDPGLVPTAEWHRPESSTMTAEECAAYAGLAVKR
jgi:O-methyltransferase involved in polyketide biosynthesis